MEFGIEKHARRATGNETVGRTERIAGRRVLPVALLAAVSAAVINVALFEAAWWLDLISHSVSVPLPSGKGPMTAAAVILSSIAGVAGAAVVLMVINRLSRRPATVFRIVATVALVLSLAGPITIPDAPATMIATLSLMHVVVWGASVGLLPTMARAEVA